MQKIKNDIPVETSEKDAAIAVLQKRGFNILPLRPPYKHVLGDYFVKKNGKYPKSVAQLLRTFLKRPNDAPCFTEDDNIAVLTGQKYNLVIIDVDYPQGGKASMRHLDLPETLTAQTGNGIHLYYRHPGCKIPTSARRLAPGIDVKGEHSFATAPPSLHYSGCRYRWINCDAEIANLPSTTVEALCALPNRSLPRNILHVLAVSDVLIPLSAMLGLLLQRSRHRPG